MKLIGVYNYTVILTYMSLISGLFGMKLASDLKFGAAIICLAISGICDLFDGTVARTKKNRTDDEKNFGIQLDSLCDVICFGVFPAVFLYYRGLNTVVGLIILALYVLFAVIRLAFFNVLEAKRQASGETGSVKRFRGLPVTTASISFPFFYVVGLALPYDVMTIVYYVLTAVTGFLFVLDIPVPKLDVSRLLRKSAAPAEQTEAEEQTAIHETV